MALHGYESGLPIIRATQDLDAIVEVRGLTHATRAFATTLTELGWRLDDADVTADAAGPGALVPVADVANGSRHRQDLAHLYARVAEPRVLAEATTTKDRQRLRRAEPLWDVLSDPELNAQARAARALILRTPTC